MHLRRITVHVQTHTHTLHVHTSNWPHTMRMAEAAIHDHRIKHCGKTSRAHLCYIAQALQTFHTRTCIASAPAKVVQQGRTPSRRRSLYTTDRPVQGHPCVGASSAHALSCTLPREVPIAPPCSSCTPMRMQDASSVHLDGHVHPAGLTEEQLQSS